MILAVDAGNSRIKWGLHDGEAWLQQGWLETVRPGDLTQRWEGLARPATMIGSNVAGDAVPAAVAEALRRWGLQAQWITAGGMQCGVRSSYQDPSQLGSDRWAALIGAWRLHRRACLVVNAGTALTIDALSEEGLFLGGVIVPGVQLMREALARNTAGLGLAQGEVRFFPNNTADAILSGCVHALAGAVERMAGFMQQAAQQQPLVVISGGAAQALLPQLNIEARLVENLVLEGLIAIAQEQAEQ